MSRHSVGVFSRTNRNERFKQMTKQQEMIEERKKEIQKRIEEKKKKEAENNKEAKEENKSSDSGDKERPAQVNVFSNDGSFLDQFRKISGQKSGVEEIKKAMVPDRSRSRSPVRTNLYSSPPPVPPPLQPHSIPPPRPMNVSTIPPPSPLIPHHIPPPPMMPPLPVPPPYMNIPPPPPPPPFSIPPLMVPPLNLNVPPPPPPPQPQFPEDIKPIIQKEVPPEIIQELKVVKKEAEEEEKEEIERETKEEIIPISSIKQEVKEEFKQEESDEIKKEQKIGEKERKRKSRWGDSKEDVKPLVVFPNTPTIAVTGMSGHLISKVTRKDPALLQYAMTAYGTTQLSDEDWKKAEDNYKVHLLYQDMMNKRAQVEKLRMQGKNKYEYDSDEETEGGTWEHKLREKEMVATQNWAESLTEMAKGKHHIGDFLPPDELKRFLDKYCAMKGGKEPELSDYKEFKLKEDNKGFQMLQKLGWSEGQGLGSDGAGIVDPINKAHSRDSNQGLGSERPGEINSDDDEYDAYRKRMMLAYRFRPNPLNNPRRSYY